MNVTDRFYSRKWGVFNHYLYVIQNDPQNNHSYGKQTSWDEMIHEFDTDVLAKTFTKWAQGIIVSLLCKVQNI